MDVMFLNHKRYSRQKKLSQLQPQMNLPQLNKRLPNQNSPFLSLIPKINLMKRPSKELKKLSRRIRINSLVLILMWSIRLLSHSLILKRMKVLRNISRKLLRSLLKKKLILLWQSKALLVHFRRLCPNQWHQRRRKRMIRARKFKMRLPNKSGITVLIKKLSEKSKLKRDKISFIK